MRKNVRLQVLALPSQTTFLFSAVILVVLAAVAASNLPGSPMSAAPPLVLILVPLILRDFLMQPDREIRAHDLRPLMSDTHPRLIDVVAKASLASGIAPAPKLMITCKTNGAIFAFGSFRRAYIGLGEKIADVIERDLDSPMADIREAAQAALEHELQHLSQGDVIAVGLARSTLKMSALFTIWSAFFLFGMATVSFAFPLADIFSPEFIRRLNEINPPAASMVGGLLTPDLAERVNLVPSWGLASLYVLNSHLPIFYTTALLLATVWRRLLRVREIYADAATANARGAARVVRSALLRYSVVASMQSSPAESQLNDKVLSLGVPNTIKGWGARAANFLGFHPPLAYRERGLVDPASVLSEPHAMGVTAGVLVLLLDLMLIGPSTLAYVAEAPGLIAVIAGFVAISWGLLPAQVVDSRETYRHLRTILISVGWVILIRTSFHLLNLALLWAMVLIAPQFATVVLDSFALNAVGILGDTTHILRIDDLFGLALEGTAFAIYVAILIAVTLYAVLLADWQLKRLTLTWYSLPNARRWINWIWWAGSVAIALGAGGIWLTIVNSLVPLTASFGFSLTEVIGIGLSIVAVSAGGTVWMWLHRRYNRRCPCCGAQIPGWFHLGKQCQTCGEVLHKWLHAQY